jgi:hypothetical protein
MTNNDASAASGHFTPEDVSALFSRWPAGILTTDATDDGKACDAFVVQTNGGRLVWSVWRDVTAGVYLSAKRGENPISGKTLAEVMRA